MTSYDDSKLIMLLIEPLISNEKIITIDANPSDTIQSLHKKILEKTLKIPDAELKLYFNAEELVKINMTLSECSIKMCSRIYWVLKDNTVPLKFLKDMEELNLDIDRLSALKTDPFAVQQGAAESVLSKLNSYCGELTTREHFYIVKTCFLGSLIQLHDLKFTDQVKLFFQNLLPNVSTNNWFSERISVAFRFCEALTLRYSKDPLYHFCVTKLSEALKERSCDDIKFKNWIGDIRTIATPINYLAQKLLDPSLQWDLINGELERKFCVLRPFLRLECAAIKFGKGSEATPLPRNHSGCTKDLFQVFKDMLEFVERHLESIKLPATTRGRSAHIDSTYLDILKELNDISVIIDGCTEKLSELLDQQKDPIRKLILESLTKSDDHLWILQHDGILDREAKLHLFMMALIDSKEVSYEQILESLIKESKILVSEESTVKNLKNPEQLHHWLLKLCQNIFTADYPLFLASPDVSAKFYPNPEANKEPGYLDLIKLAGKVIALALRNKWGMGVTFHRAFLLLLAEKKISSEDVMDILKMDTEYFAKSLSNPIRMFAEGFNWVFGVPIKRLLNHKGFVFEDINEVLGRQQSPFSSEPGIASVEAKDSHLTKPLKARFQDVKKFNPDDFVKSQKPVLGEGSFGKVYMGLKKSGSFCAIKEIKLTDDLLAKADMTREQVMKEVELLSQLDHSNVVNYLGHHIISMRVKNQNIEKLCIFLELVGGPGSLEKLNEDGYKFKLKDSQVSFYTYQILEGLKHLHDRLVAHRDIKCGNILVNGDGGVKIADFGLAKVTNFDTLILSDRGTPEFQAPEVCNAKFRGYCGFKADIWSLGCTVLHMLTWKHQFKFVLDCVLNKDRESLKHQRKQKNFDEVFECLSEEALDFILKCLQKEPKNRPTAAQLLEDPYVKSHADATMKDASNV